jgi:hypothetical protein
VAPISNTPVSRESLKVPGDDKRWDEQRWDESLWRHHLYNRVQVFESSWRPEVIDEVDSLAEMTSGRHMALTSPGLDIFPYASGIFAKHFGPNARALSARLDDGVLLECQHIRHVMFKGPKMPPWGIALMEFLVGEHALRIDEDLTEVLHTARFMIHRQMLDTLKLRWDLLTNLESLFLDFSTLDFVESVGPRHLTNIFRKMGKHLQLKLLVVKGLPMKLRFTEPSSEQSNGWFDTELQHVDPEDTLESLLKDKTIDDWIRFYETQKSVFGQPSYIHFIKDCLRPGGKLHVIDDVRPGTWEWPGPRGIETDDWLDEVEGSPLLGRLIRVCLVMCMALVICRVAMDLCPGSMRKKEESDT